MPLFTSPRERRLWSLTLAVVVAIYATLGLARTLAGELRNRGLFDGLFALGAVVFVAAVVIVGLRARPRGAEVGAALGVGAAYVMAFTRIAIPEERTHLLEYGVVALLVHEALRERASQGRRVPRPAVLAIVVTALLGLLDECIQALLPGRVFDPVDVGFNALAALMAVTGTVGLRRVARRRLAV